jgi:hypothetical protein
MAIEPTLLLRIRCRCISSRGAMTKANCWRSVTEGMEMMIKDGSLNALFQQYKGESIRAGGLQQRRVLHLPNPT